MQSLVSLSAPQGCCGVQVYLALRKCNEKQKIKKNKHRLETLGGDYSYCNAGF